LSPALQATPSLLAPNSPVPLALDWNWPPVCAFTICGCSSGKNLPAAVPLPSHLADAEIGALTSLSSPVVFEAQRVGTARLGGIVFAATHDRPAALPRPGLQDECIGVPVHLAAGSRAGRTPGASGFPLRRFFRARAEAPRKEVGPTGISVFFWAASRVEFRVSAHPGPRYIESHMFASRSSELFAPVRERAYVQLTPARRFAKGGPFLPGPVWQVGHLCVYRKLKPRPA